MNPMRLEVGREVWYPMGLEVGRERVLKLEKQVNPMRLEVGREIVLELD